MRYTLIILFISFCSLLSAQSSELKVATVGFYNLENLFDTENDTTINDEEFLPNGDRHWNQERYDEKLSNMAYAISQIGSDLVKSGLSILGVSEIENRKVLEDLVNHPLLKSRNYKIVHYDSPDWRGIDVGLIYNPAHFTVTDSKTHEVKIYKNGERRFTRDVLEVTGDFDGEKMTFLVNHWPSRSGGEAASASRRMKAAEVNKAIVDSILTEDPNAKIVLMGDLNDDPTSVSIKNGLNTANKKRHIKKKKLYNPMYDFFRRGIGSNAYRDSWSLFDQIIVSEGLFDDKKGYHFFKANVFNKRFLIQKSGKYKDYPFRTFSGTTFIGGYSDHFPVYIYLVKGVFE